LVDSLTSNYDERYGYRSISYGVEKRVINVLAAAHERDRIGAGCKVLLDLEDDPNNGAASAGTGAAGLHSHGRQPAVVIKQVIPPGGAEQDPSKRKKLFGLF